MTELDRLGWVVSGSYALAGLGFGIRTTSRDFGEWLDRALHEHRVEREATPHYSVVIAEGTGNGSLAKERYHALFEGGLKIVTTLDPRMQDLAESKVKEILPDPAGQFNAALVSVAGAGVNGERSRPTSAPGSVIAGRTRRRCAAP